MSGLDALNDNQENLLSKQQNSNGENHDIKNLDDIKENLLQNDSINNNCQKTSLNVQHQNHQVNDNDHFEEKQNIIQESTIQISISNTVVTNNNTEDIEISITTNQTDHLLPSIQNGNILNNEQIDSSCKNDNQQTNQEKAQKESDGTIKIVNDENEHSEKIEQAINNIDNAKENTSNDNNKNINKDENPKQPAFTPPPQNRQKITFAESNYNKNSSARNIQKSSKVAKSYSQSSIYMQKQLQNQLSPTSPTQNMTPNANKRDGKILHSKTMPSSPSKLTNAKYGLFERSLKKTRFPDEDSDNLENYTFTYSNKYRKPVVSDITSEKRILNEVQKRKMYGMKEKSDEVDEMKNQQFKASNYTKMLAKRAIQKKNEKELLEKAKDKNKSKNKSKNTDDEYYEYEDDDDIFSNDQILPDDTERLRSKRMGKMPAYLSRIGSFIKDHKDIINAAKQEEIRNLKKTRK